MVLSWTLIFGAYFVLPIGRESGFRAGLRLAVDLALVCAVVLWQIRRISQGLVARAPRHRGTGDRRQCVPGRVLVDLPRHVPRVVVDLLPGSRSRSEALYFTITVFSTVGFGDITPRTDPARLVVAAQMLLNLVLIGAVVRLLFDAARNRVVPNRRSAGDGPES